MPEVVKVAEVPPVEPTVKSDPRQYIRKDVLDTLVNGSMEQKIAEMTSIVESGKVLFLGEGVEGDVSVLATFNDNKALVATSNGEIYRVEFSEKDGSLGINKVDPIEVPKMDQSQFEQYALSELAKLVEEFVKSQKFDDSQWTRTVELMRYV